jgi:hypothetical protein
MWGNPHPISRTEPVGGLYSATIHPHLTPAQDPVDMALRHIFQRFQQEIVDPLAGLLLNVYQPYTDASGFRLPLTLILLAAHRAESVLENFL